jgi:hypothetical protein
LFSLPTFSGVVWNVIGGFFMHTAMLRSRAALAGGSSHLPMSAAWM